MCTGMCLNEAASPAKTAWNCRQTTPLSSASERFCLTGSPLNSAQEIARLSAQMLLEIKAIHFNTDTPVTLASGLPRPTYIDCRKVISFHRVRSTLMDFMCQALSRDSGYEAFDNIAGGETAGIPFAALAAERLALPISYIHKKP